MTSGEHARERVITEERSWYADGHVVMHDRSGVAWAIAPYRRFWVPWYGRRIATPWYPRPVGDRR